MDPASRQPRFALLVAGAWLCVVLQLLLQHWPETALTLNDTDDAMRLTQLRAWLAGQGWFDLHEARVQPPLGYDPHWSRLVDAGLAGIYLLFRPFADQALAERLMRTAWPLLWVLPAIIGVSAIAWRIAGREAALIVLLFAAIGLPAFQQFKPGRIDHHNVQIAIAALTVAATAWSDRKRWCAAAAGALTGFGLAIGFEGMPFLVLCGAIMAIRFAADPTGAAALRDYGCAVAASSAAGFLVSVGSGHWEQGACDSLAINSAAAVVVGGLGLALVSAHGETTRAVRCGLIASVAFVAALLFVWLDPSCLSGPYALVDPAVDALWLAHVREMQPLISVFADNPLTGLGISTFPSVAVIAVLGLATHREWRRDFGFLTASSALLLAVAMMLAAIKGYAYVMWLAMPLVAVLALRLFALLRLKSLLPRFIIGLLLTPAALSAGAISIAEAAGVRSDDEPRRAVQKACFQTQSYTALSHLPPGLVVADIDYGPFLLALTPHAVLTAPYHRLSSGIIQAHRIFASPPDAARKIVKQLGADYVVTCGPRAPSGMSDAEQAASLWGQLQAGNVPRWLVAEPGAAGELFRVYRVRS